MNPSIHGRARIPNVPKRSQRGQNIIGVLFGLAIIVVFIGFIVAHFLQAKDSSSSTSAATDMLAIIAKTQQTFSGVPAGYAGVVPRVLIADGDVPAADIQNSNSIVLSGFGTAPVNVAPVSLYGGANNGLQFAISVPQDQCADFLRAISGSAVILSVLGTTLKNTTNGLAFNPSALSKACGAPGAGGEVEAYIAIAQ